MAKYYTTKEYVSGTSSLTEAKYMKSRLYETLELEMGGRGGGIYEISVVAKNVFFFSFQCFTTWHMKGLSTLTGKIQCVLWN